MRTWMVVNEYLRKNKYKELDDLLIAAAKDEGLSVEVFFNSELPVCYGLTAEQYFEEFSLTPPDFVLFWDKDVRLALWLESMGLRVYNSAESIALCDDKSATHQRLAGAGIPMPETMIAPFTYENIGYSNYHFLSAVEKRFGFPVVVKECFGSFGAQVYLASGREELLEIVKKIGTKPMLFQRFVKESAGRDIRLQVIGEQVAAGMCRRSQDGDFRANLSNGGSATPYEAEEEEKALAVRCCRLLGLTYGGVDLLYSPDRGRLVCEVNSNAHFKNIYECTGVNVARKMLQHMIQRSVQSR